MKVGDTVIIRGREDTEGVISAEDNRTWLVGGYRFWKRSLKCTERRVRLCIVARQAALK